MEDNEKKPTEKDEFYTEEQTIEIRKRIKKLKIYFVVLFSMVIIMSVYVGIGKFTSFVDDHFILFIVIFLVIISCVLSMGVISFLEVRSLKKYLNENK